VSASLRPVARVVLAVGVFFLAWWYGATLLVTVPTAAETGRIVHVLVATGGLVLLATGLALAVGIVVPRRPQAGFVVLMALGTANGALGLLTLLDHELGSFTGIVLFGIVGAAITGIVLLVVGASIALGAATLLAVPAPGAAVSATAPPVTSTLREPSTVGTGLAFSVGIAGALLLARALLELAQGLAELPGASEHWAGDVALWLIIVLPLPIAVGSVALVAGRWLARDPIVTGVATAAWLALVLASAGWLVMANLAAADGGGSFRPFEDPLLWYPEAAILGSVGGALVLVLSALIPRRSPG
jgi:hypothetical protein